MARKLVIKKVQQKSLLTKGFRFQVIRRGKSFVFQNQQRANAFIKRGGPIKRRRR